MKTSTKNKETKEIKTPEVVKEETTTPKVDKKTKRIKHILYAVDSDKFDKDIEKDSEKASNKVTILVKDKYSKASIDKFLKSRKVRLITTFAIKFDKENFDLGFIEKEMVRYIPKRIVKMMQSKK